MRIASVLPQIALLTTSSCFAQTNEVNDAIREMLVSIRTRIVHNQSDFKLISHIEIPEVVTKGTVQSFAFEKGRQAPGTKIKSPTWSKEAINTYVSVEYPLKELHQTTPTFQMRLSNGLVLECRYGAFVSDPQNQAEVLNFVNTVLHEEIKVFTNRMIALGGEFKSPF